MTGISVLVLRDEHRPKAERWSGTASVRVSAHSIIDCKFFGATRMDVWTRCLGFVEQTLEGLEGGADALG